MQIATWQLLFQADVSECQRPAPGPFLAPDFRVTAHHSCRMELLVVGAAAASFTSWYRMAGGKLQFAFLWAM